MMTLKQAAALLAAQVQSGFKIRLFEEAMLDPTREERAQRTSFTALVAIQPVDHGMARQFNLPAGSTALTSGGEKIFEGISDFEPPARAAIDFARNWQLRPRAERTIAGIAALDQNLKAMKEKISADCGTPPAFLRDPVQRELPPPRVTFAAVRLLGFRWEANYSTRRLLQFLLTEDGSPGIAGSVHQRADRKGFAWNVYRRDFGHLIGDTGDTPEACLAAVEETLSRGWNVPLTPRLGRNYPTLPEIVGMQGLGPGPGRDS